VNPGARSGNGFAFPRPLRRRCFSYVADFLATSEGLALVKAFVCIEDPKLRRAIVRLVEEIVPETGSSNED
jgi:hypothetical protein